ncbi:origin recognition complex subunit 3 N-terminus-domain-containing protein [Syncephalis plumigaleata]|nr:origin recognition complex subunit 3 N-terminus-domain-containing protein [Syncephalis plumigaleata]
MVEIENYNGFCRLFDGDEPLVCMQQRHESFKQVWHEVHTVLESIIQDAQSTTFEALVHFTDRAYQASNNTNAISLPRHEIPTALVFAGINIPDHNLIFGRMADTLTRPSTLGIKSPGHYVALLRAASCHDIRSAMRSIIAQFINTPMEDNNEIDDDADIEEEEMMSLEPDRNEDDPISEFVLHDKPRKSRMSDFDIHTLLAWYEHLVKEDASQLVVIFQDFESFDTTVLHDIITVCSEYTDRLPFVFVFGIATSMEAVHQSLTFSALCLLRTEKFKLQEANECVNSLVDHLFISGDYGFQLGLAPFNLILDRFTLHNLSVDSVINTLHYSVMAHFYANPLSFMPCQPNSHLETAAEWLVEDHAEWIRMQPSFQKHVETLDSLPLEAARLLEDDDYLLKVCVPKWIRALRVHRVKIAVAFHTLLALQSQLSTLPGKRRELRVVHMFALREDLGDSPLVTQTCQAVQQVDSAELRNILLDVQDLFSDSDMHKAELECINNFLKTLDTVEQDFRALHKHKKRDLSEIVIQSPWEKMNRTTQKSSSSVAVLRADTKPAEVEYSKLVKSVADWLEAFFKRDFIHHTHYTLYECLYFSSSSLLQKAFTPQLRATVQTALRLPVHYLGCACCKDKSGSILSTQPDTSILYQLYLECGRWINLHDWFVAYRSIVNGDANNDEDDDEDNDEQDEESMTLRARFVQSVAELQFLGMIKPTQRKTDHVERLNWGTG